VGFFRWGFYCQPCAKVVGTQNAHNLITISTDGKAWEQLSCIIQSLFTFFFSTVFIIQFISGTSSVVFSSVSDPYLFYADPDPAFVN
jgi:hypothetical protein